MANISIDTKNDEYKQLLASLQSLSLRLAPQVKVLKDLSKENQLKWVTADPLMKEAIKFALSFLPILDEELIQ